MHWNRIEFCVELNYDVGELFNYPPIGIGNAHSA
jgi:hypothetical protein